MPPSSRSPLSTSSLSIGGNRVQTTAPPPCAPCSSGYDISRESVYSRHHPSLSNVSSLGLVLDNNFPADFWQLWVVRGPRTHIISEDVVDTFFQHLSGPYLTRVLTTDCYCSTWAEVAHDTEDCKAGVGPLTPF